MYIVMLLGFLALANAAPHYGFHHHDHYRHYPYSFQSEFADCWMKNIIDTGRLWNDLQRYLSLLNNMFSDLNKRLVSIASTEKIEGNQYVITIPLTGYKEDDIVVKAKKGLLIIEAVKNKADGQSERSYQDVRTLPDFVNENGSWSFIDDILKITFPLEKSDKTDTVVSSTGAPQYSSGRFNWPHEDYDSNVMEGIDIKK